MRFMVLRRTSSVLMVRAACAAALADGCRPGVDHHGEYLVDWTDKLGDPTVTNPTIHSCFSYAAQMVVIDRATGDIDEVVAVHDVGRAVNPLLVEGQVEGSVHMGLGYALSEDFPADPETAMTALSRITASGARLALDDAEARDFEGSLDLIGKRRAVHGLK